MDRIYLKKRGKAAFKQNYWKSVLVAILLTIAVGGLGASSARSVNYTGDTQQYTFTEEEFETIDPFGNLEGADEDADVSALLPGGNDAFGSSLPISVSIGTAGSYGGLGLLLTIFLFGPLEVGCRNFFKKNLRTPAELDELSVGFKPKYWHNVGTMLLVKLFTFLWSLLLIIPGIVMYYAYAMTPYLLNDHPDLQPKEVTDLSRNMMKGHKWDLFVLDLSFLGWIILSALTLGLVEVFYAGPYIASTHAAFYEELKARSSEIPVA